MSLPPTTSFDQLRQQGVQEFRNGNLAEAQRTLEAARIAARQLAHKQGEAEVSNDLGVVCQKLQRYDDARQYFESALHLFAETNDDIKRAQTMGNLGTLLAQQKKHREAEIRLEQAAEIFHKLHDAQNEALTLKWLSRVHMQHGDIFGAIFAYERALARLEPLSGFNKWLRWLLQIPLRMMSPSQK